MAEPKPEKAPGESWPDYLGRLEAWQAAQNAEKATGSDKPGVNNTRPAGTEVSPGRIISPNLLTQYTYSPTSGWTASTYAPNADDKRAAGGGGGGTTNNSTNYTAKNIADRTTALLATGNYVRDLPAGFTLLPGGSKAIGPNNTAMQKDNQTNLWSPSFVTTADRQAGIAGARGQATAPGATLPLAPMTNLSPEARQFAGLAQFAGPGGALEQRGGAVIPGFGAFTQPGIGIPSEGRQTLYTGNGLNTMYTGGQGSTQQIPIAPGFRGPGQVGNSISFASGASGGGRVEPQSVFSSVPLSVPGTYVQGQGNVGAANQAYSVPFNIGPNGAALANIGGSNVQLNSPDKGVGFGFALNAPPESNFFSATHREGSRDPATQAIQTLQLIGALNTPGGFAALNAVNPNQYGGFHAGTGNPLISGNGGTGQQTWFQGYNPDDEKNRDGSGGAFGFGEFSPESRG